MGIFDEIVEDIKNKLSANTNLSDVNFINAYRSNKYPNPVKHPYVTIGVSAVDASLGAFGNYFGNDGQSEHYGKNCLLTIGMRIYSPKIKEGAFCSDIFSRMCDCLFFDVASNKINKISCKEVTFDKNLDAYALDSSLRMKVFISNTSNEIEISDIKVEGVL